MRQEAQTRPQQGKAQDDALGIARAVVGEGQGERDHEQPRRRDGVGAAQKPVEPVDEVGRVAQAQHADGDERGADPIDEVDGDGIGPHDRSRQRDPQKDRLDTLVERGLGPKTLGDRHKNSRGEFDADVIDGQRRSGDQLSADLDPRADTYDVVDEAREHDERHAQQDRDRNRLVREAVHEVSRGVKLDQAGDLRGQVRIDDPGHQPDENRDAAHVGDGHAMHLAGVAGAIDHAVLHGQPPHNRCRHERHQEGDHKHAGVPLKKGRLVNDRGALHASRFRERAGLRRESRDLLLHRHDLRSNLGLDVRDARGGGLEVLEVHA